MVGRFSFDPDFDFPFCPGTAGNEGRTITPLWSICPSSTPASKPNHTPIDTHTHTRPQGKGVRFQHLLKIIFNSLTLLFFTTTTTITFTILPACNTIHMHARAPVLGRIPPSLVYVCVVLFAPVCVFVCNRAKYMSVAMFTLPEAFQQRALGPGQF